MWTLQKHTATLWHMRDICVQCLRPQTVCFCEDVKRFDPGVKFLILIHPKEARKQKTGTGRLTHLSLINSELIIGSEFTDNERVNCLINNPAYFPVMLYPGSDVYYTGESRFQTKIDGKKLLFVLFDATWSMAGKMMRRSANLNDLPRLSFKNEYVSRFAIKTQPKPYCLSTIETAYHLITELKETDLIDRTIDQQGLMDVFIKMVDYQIYRHEKRTKKTISC
jgi:DTW domain-containing protein YfiP